METNFGYCQCGCGKKTSITKKNDSSNGRIKNQPMKYIQGHNNRGRNGSDNNNWKGGKHLNRGYVYILKPDHPRADHQGYVLEHILVVEEVLGKPLPKGAVVHHANGVKSNNQKKEFSYL